MNILFTTSAAPQKSPFFTEEKRPPLGIGFLMSITRKLGHNVFFIDNYLSPSNFIDEGFLQKNMIDLVGIYANTICFNQTLKMLEEINTLRICGKWEGIIVVGGPHTSVLIETIPSFVDYIVVGEGETAIKKIIEGSVTDRVIKEERIQELDPLPFQPWDVFSKLPYDWSCPWMDITPCYTMNTSRGCPFDCSFCSVNSIWGKKYTFMSAKRIVDEIEYLIKKYNIKAIYFREDHFTLSRKRTEEFCNLLIERKISISWACETRVDNLDDEIISLMCKSGCKAVYLGVESGSETMLQIMNKKISIEKIRNVTDLFKKNGVFVYWSMIVGLPQETFNDYLESKKLVEEVEPNYCGYNIFVGIPGSKLYRELIEKKEYDYIDDIGLAYLPGYNIKTRFFYGLNSNELVNHNFTKRSEYDKEIIKYTLLHPFLSWKFYYSIIKDLKRRLYGY
jgi:radical SAM superfamily enzyme YgiQ (UPF0313 family)